MLKKIKKQVSKFLSVPVYRDEIREYDAQTGAKKQAILEKHTVANQLNIMRKAILSGDMTELKALDDLINGL